jgi:AraC-like DNA-binding protein
VWKRIVAKLSDGHFETVGTAAFEPSMTLRPAGPGAAGETQGSPLLFDRTAKHIAGQSRPFLIIQCITAGEFDYLDEQKRRLPARQGDVVMITSHFPLGFITEQRRATASLTLPFNTVAPRFVNSGSVRARFERGIFRSGLATDLLFELVTGLARGEGGCARESTIADAVGSLVALALEEGGGEPLDQSNAAAARLLAIRDYVRTHYADPGLSPASVAEKFRISVRYLHKLLEPSGRSFAAELLALRLAAVRMGLLDMRKSSKTIAELAFGSGFADLSQFNRGFRKAYGMSPSELRRFAR